MKRTRFALFLGLATALPAAAAASFFSAADPPGNKPCFAAGDIGYRLADNGAADITVRIDNAAARPDLRLQLTDDAAAADFVLADGDSADACTGVAAVQTIRLDAGARHPDLTVALTRKPAAYKIYVQSPGASQQAAALFAAIWRNAGKTARSGREFAARD